ncbi:MAG TPA: hypothetical protein VIH99_10975 [Bdellovibrionota bacterium]|jgi:hypothetical protein
MNRQVVRLFLLLFVGLAAPGIAFSHGKHHCKKEKCENCGHHGDKAEKDRNDAKSNIDKNDSAGSSMASGHGASGSRAFGSNGQGSGTGTTGSGFGQMANAMAGYASQMNQQASDITKAQEAASQDMQSPDPETQKQGQEAYDYMEDTKKLLQEAAKEYSAKQAEFSRLAEKSGTNARNLGSEEGNKIAGGAPLATSPSEKAGPDSGMGQGLPSEIASGNGTSPTLEKPIAAGAAKNTVTADAGKDPDIALTDKQGKKDPLSKAADASASKDAAAKSGDSRSVSGASRADGSNSSRRIRDSLREKLKGSDEVSSTSDVDKIRKNKEANGNEKLDPKGDAKFVSTANSKSEADDDSLENFGQPRGIRRLELAGSETDALVKKLTHEYFGDADDKGLRKLSSEKSGPGIESADGPSLFARCHAFHLRCALKGCVSAAGSHR